MVSKKNIAEAVAKFISNDLAQGADDRQMKLVLCLAKETLIDNCDILDEFFENPLIRTVIHEEDGLYDIKDFTAMLKKVLDDYGSYPVAVPKVPLLLSHEKTIRINSSDIEKIVGYMHDEEEEIVV